ncbi:galectin-6-like isoform X1 [Colossoma macropomum]|uniref:galectin-6-like isoform X1 n=1 Tax=Colossoma macropomum TaxID=42526 RepID=UPI001863F203|nr:galectin-6-like isoform X1 [Colossoma macropomum]
MAFLAPPGYQPIYNPSIPYVGPINGGLRAGMSVYIQGKIHHHINRFHVNLQCGEFDGCDIALHLNPRFDHRDKVIFNTFQNGSWEGEEKVKHMPFRKGEHFELIIVVNTEGYQVTVNGTDFYLFQHRLPLERVCALEIGGDVAIDTINIIGGMQGGMGGMGRGYPGGMGGGMGGIPGGMGGGMGGGYPGPGMGGFYPGSGMGGGYPGPGMGGMGVRGGFPGPGMGGGGMGFPGGNLPVMGLQPIFNPGIPYSDMIPGGMTFKRTIIIRGMVPYGADRFCINFVVGGSRDIAFHLNPRIREGVVVRNSLIGGCWGNEERDIDFNPFLEGQFFEISIRCGQDKFKVFANGQHMFTFYHRLAYAQISMLEVEGDVQISYIHY